MKALILYKLKQIKSVAIATNMEGKVSISFDGVPVKEFDSAIAEITEFEHNQHSFQLTPKLVCYVLLN